MLQSIWKDMTNESTERLCASAIASLEEEEKRENAEPVVKKIKLMRLKR